MSLSPAGIDALVALGLSAEQLALVVKAEMAAEAAVAEARLAEKREANAERQRRKRAKDAASRLSRVTDVTERDDRDAPCPPDVPPERTRDQNPPLTPQTQLVVVEARADEIVEVFDEWNRTAKQSGMRTASKLTSERRSRARARLAEHGREAFTEAIRRAGASAFCRGENDRGWKADFDFIVKPQSFLGLIEGKYDDRTPRSSNQRSGSHRRTASDLLHDLRVARMGG